MAPHKLVAAHFGSWIAATMLLLWWHPSTITAASVVSPSFFSTSQNCWGSIPVLSACFEHMFRAFDKPRFVQRLRCLIRWIYDVDSNCMRHTSFRI